MSELCGFVYNKGHQKSRETPREIWRSEGDLDFTKNIYIPQTDLEWNKFQWAYSNIYTKQIMNQIRSQQW